MRSTIKRYFKTNTLKGQEQVQVLNLALNLHKQEDKIFWETIEMKWLYGAKINILDRELYDFQMLVELLQRFWSKEKIDSLLEAQHELMLSFRFMLIWHYNSSGKHLRSYMEHIIDYLSTDNEKSWNQKIKNIVKESTYKQEELIMIEPKQIYIIYSYLSNKYTHHSDPFNNLALNRDKLNEIRDSITMIILLSARLIFGVHGKIIEDHYFDIVLNPVQYEKNTYRSYIKAIIWDVWFYNTLMEWWLRKKIQDKDWNTIDMTLRIDEEYHESRKDLF